MPFRTQRDYRLKPRNIAGDRLRRVALKNTRQNNACLHLCQRHPDTGARAASEGEVRPRGHLQPGRWIETHRFIQNPIEIRESGKILKRWLATGECRADLILQLDTYLR